MPRREHSKFNPNGHKRRQWMVKGMILGKEYVYKELLGRGASGKVYSAEDKLPKPGHETVAVKQLILPDRGAGSSGRKRKRMLTGVYRETQQLEGLEHKNIVMYICTYSLHRKDIERKKSDKNAFSINVVMEYMAGGPLPYLLNMRRDKGEIIKEEDVVFYMRQILEGLRYIHNQGVVHYDVKGDNILVGQDGTVKIADFGVASEADPEAKKDEHAEPRGTNFFMAPEVVKNERRMDPLSDIWSSGMTAVQLYAGKTLLELQGYEAHTAIYEMHKPGYDPLAKDKLPQELAGISQGFLGFLKCCFLHVHEAAAKAGRQRWSAEKLLTHPFLTSVKAEDIELTRLRTQTLSECALRAANERVQKQSKNIKLQGGGNHTVKAQATGEEGSGGTMHERNIYVLRQRLAATRAHRNRSCGVASLASREMSLGSTFATSTLSMDITASMEAPIPFDGTSSFNGEEAPNASGLSEIDAIWSESAGRSSNLLTGTYSNPSTGSTLSRGSSQKMPGTLQIYYSEDEIALAQAHVTNLAANTASGSPVQRTMALQQAMWDFRLADHALIAAFVDEGVVDAVATTVADSPTIDMCLATTRIAKCLIESVHVISNGYAQGARLFKTVVSGLLEAVETEVQSRGRATANAAPLRPADGVSGSADDYSYYEDSGTQDDLKAAMSREELFVESLSSVASWATLDEPEWVTGARPADSIEMVKAVCSAVVRAPDEWVALASPSLRTYAVASPVAGAVMAAHGALLGRLLDVAGAQGHAQPHDRVQILKTLKALCCDSGVTFPSNNGTHQRIYEFACAVVATEAGVDAPPIALCTVARQMVEAAVQNLLDDDSSTASDDDDDDDDDGHSGSGRAAAAAAEAAGNIE